MYNAIWIVIVAIGFLIGCSVGYQILMDQLKKEGYVVFTHQDKEIGKGRYKIIDLTDYQKEQTKGEK